MNFKRPRQTNNQAINDREPLSITLVITLILFGLILLAFITFIIIRHRRRRRKPPKLKDPEKAPGSGRPPTRGKGPASAPGPPIIWRKGKEGGVEDILPRMRALAAEQRERQERKEKGKERAVEWEARLVNVDALGIGVGSGLPRIEIDLAESVAEESIRGIEVGGRRGTPLPPRTADSEGVEGEGSISGEGSVGVDAKEEGERKEKEV